MFGKKKAPRVEPGAEPTERGQKSSLPENPYVAARREWNERYGDFIAQAHNWRLAAFAFAGISVFAVLGVIYIGAQSKFVPYVVEKDGNGNIINIGYAKAAPSIGRDVLRAYISRFFQDVRTVSTDLVLEKQAVGRIYSMLPQNSAALNKMNDYFQKNSPFERAQKIAVSVDVDDPLPISDQSWAVEWTETIRDHNGAVVETQRWKATAQIMQVAPGDAKTDLRNPLGIFVPDFDWILERK